MIYLNAVHLLNFKGVKEIVCNFEDITLLSGLNNSGKTTILQAVHLLTSALPLISSHPHIFLPNSQVRNVDLTSSLSSLGFQGGDTLFPQMQRREDSTVTGYFSNGLVVEIRPMAGTTFYFTVSSTSPSSEEEMRGMMSQLHKCSSEFVTPPGTVSSREDMMPLGGYQSMLSQGKGSGLWRNAIWWSVQQDGYESFEAVKSLVGKYFPDVEVLQPTLGTSNPPEIILSYKERNGAKLDFAQSGAGLRTFLTLSRLLQQSSANILLLDEPDAHLHASQQEVVIKLLMDTAMESGRQVIVASHSPEFIVRTPVECLRWIDPNATSAQPDETQLMLERLGVTPDVHSLSRAFPEVIVYVEGKTDKPVIQDLVAWCRRKYPDLPNVTVATHRDGRFDAPSLQAINRVITEMREQTRIIGIRDLDWYYNELPREEPDVRIGDNGNWRLLTLPYKELENLFCDPHFLFLALGKRVPEDAILRIVNEESLYEVLVNEWAHQIKFRIREALPSRYDNVTREREADQTFNTWKNDPHIRRRLVGGKELMRRIRGRLKNEFQINLYSQQVFQNLDALTPIWANIANAIFPDVDFGTAD